MTYWVPYQAEATASGGANGVFLIPSNNPGAAKSFINNTAVDFTEYLTQYITDNGSNIIQPVISEAFFLTDTGTSDHLFGLALGDLSTTPTPTQISSLTLNTYVTLADHVCIVFAYDQILNMPSSAVIFIQTAGNASGQCGYFFDNVMYVVHADQSSSTPPVVAPVMANGPYPLYDANTGNLDGLLYVDGNQNLTFSDTAFAHPVVLLSGVSIFSEVYAQQGVMFASIAVNGKTSLYRITPSTISSDLYDFQSLTPPSDESYPSSEAIAAYDPVGGNLWISDNAGIFGGNNDNLESYSDNLLRVPLSGSSPGQVIYTASGSFDNGPGAFYAIDPIGFIGSSLVFNLQSSTSPTSQGPGLPYAEAPPGTPASVNTLPTASAPGAQPTVIETLASGYYDGNYVADGTIFHTAYGLNSGGAVTTAGFEALNSSGIVLQSIANSLILGSSSQVSGTPLAPVNSIQTLYIGEGYAGLPPASGEATVYAMSPSSLSQVPLTLSGGAPYVVSTQQYPTTILGGLPLSPEFSYGQSMLSTYAAALDTTNNILTPLAAPTNSELYPFYPTGTGF